MLACTGVLLRTVVRRPMVDTVARQRKAVSSREHLGDTCWQVSRDQPAHNQTCKRCLTACDRPSGKRMAARAQSTAAWCTSSPVWVSLVMAPVTASTPTTSRLADTPSPPSTCTYSAVVEMFHISLNHHIHRYIGCLVPLCFRFHFKNTININMKLISFGTCVDTKISI